HAGGRQVQSGRRAETAGAEQQHLRVEQLQLSLDADLRDEHVARIALALFRGEAARDVDLIATVLPQRDLTSHRGHVRVAEVLFQRPRGPGRAVSRLAIEHDLCVPIWDDALDTALQVALWHVPGARRMPGADLLGLAGVDERHALVEELVRPRRVYLLDPALDLAKQLSSRGTHRKLLNHGRNS